VAANRTRCKKGNIPTEDMSCPPRAAFPFQSPSRSIPEMASTHPIFRYNSRILIALLFVILLYFRHSIQVILSIATLPITWKLTSSDFYISSQRDDFDITFSNYSEHKQSSGPEYPDLIPPILHQISLGHRQPREAWVAARNACLSYHPDWETYFWTDDNASKFVEEKFPHLKDMWHGYKFPIQRIDALRYMVLHEYGGNFLNHPFITFLY
jgi:mannosyltransferase OCH1-like enzyme